MIFERRQPYAPRAALLALALIFTFLCYLLARQAPFWGPELGMTDKLFALRGPRPVRDDFVIVSVDNRDRPLLKSDGEPDRRALADLIRKAKAGGARAVVLDVYLPDRTTHAADADLWRAIANAGNVFLPAVYLPDRSNVLSPDDIRNLRFLEESILTGSINAYGPPPGDYTFWKFQPPVSDFTHSAAGKAGGVGVAPYETDEDGVLRRVRLAYQTDIVYPPGSKASRLIKQGNVTDVAAPSIVLPVAQYLTKIRKDFVIVNYGRDVNFAGDLQPPVDIPVDREGRMLINYVGPVGTFPYVKAADVLKPGYEEDKFKGKVVFIGVTEGPKADFHATPYSAQSPRVDITANAVATVLDRATLAQSAAGSWVPLGLLALFLALTFPFFTALGATLWALICLLGYGGLVWFVFAATPYGILPILPAFLLILLMWLATLALQPVVYPRRRTAYAA